MQNWKNFLLKGAKLKQFNYVKGKKNEQLAYEYLKKRKYKILEINYVNAIGEIDIIAKDKNAIVFVEVKFRESAAFGYPMEAVDVRKQNKIRRVATIYLKQNSLFDEEIRFDILSVLGEEITHIENAF